MHETNENTPQERADFLQESLDNLNETAMAILVQLSRIYDVLAATAAETSTPAIIEILDGHDEGVIYTSAPNLVGFDGQSGKETNENL